MLPSVFLGLFEQATQSLFGFLVTLLIIGAVSGLLTLLCRGKKGSMQAREGMLIVGLSWILISIFGCLPFVFSGAIPSFLDALFETVSGFTTTGATILEDVECLSMAILYWRSFTHWLGGMGVLVFLLILAPGKGQDNGFTIHLLRAESPGPSVDKLMPRIRDTAKTLYKLYIALTLLELVFLLLGKMPVFDAVCTAFGTAGTGGFGIKNDSIGGYSAYIQNVCTVFMLLFGVNFTCYYLLLMGQVRKVFKDEELRLYVCTVLCCIGLIAWNIHSLYASIGETLRHAAFQVASIITTTGFATTDFDVWPTFSRAILLCLMFVGACAGSTGGGLKFARLLLLLKTLRRNIHTMVRPNDVKVIRNNDHVVSEKIVQNTNAYFAAYVLIIFTSFILVSLDGQTLITTFSAVVACFNNIGPGFDSVGATCNYASFGILAKLVLIVDMLAGRLEIFPILTLFVPDMWKRR